MDFILLKSSLEWVTGGGGADEFWFYVYNRVFHKLDENANIGIFVFTYGRGENNIETNKSQVTKCYPQWEPGPLVASDSKSQHQPFWTNLTFACKTETLGSLYSHALLIKTKSSKSKNQVVHEEKFEDLDCWTWLWEAWLLFP